MLHIHISEDMNMSSIPSTQTGYLDLLKYAELQHLTRFLFYLLTHGPLRLLELGLQTLQFLLDHRVLALPKALLPAQLFNLRPLLPLVLLKL